MAVKLFGSVTNKAALAARVSARRLMYGDNLFLFLKNDLDNERKEKKDCILGSLVFEGTTHEVPP